jgi:hypothetical protein
MPPEVAQALTVTDANASEVGSRLWAANHDAFNYGGPRRLAHPELVAEREENDEIEERPRYEFQLFEGTPSLTLALNRVGYYSYQTRGDYWERPSDWDRGTAPFELRFTFGMEWWACKSLSVDPKVNPYRIPGQFMWQRDDGQIDHPTDLQTSDGRKIWRLGEDDRDLFTLDLQAI